MERGRKELDLEGRGREVKREFCWLVCKFLPNNELCIVIHAKMV